MQHASDSTEMHTHILYASEKNENLKNLQLVLSIYYMLAWCKLPSKVLARRIFQFKSFPQRLLGLSSWEKFICGLSDAALSDQIGQSLCRI